METILNAIENVIISIGSIYNKTNGVLKIILMVIELWGFYHVFYRIFGFFYTRKFKPTQNKHKYAICIAARNEEPVIGNLLASIKNQDYPSENLTVFVVADNCTDKTAQVAREMGAICYERFDDVHKTKGFALQFLFKNIAKDYGIDSFEGYFIFDADNLLNRDYITRMNEAFDAGEKIITSYRNTKNFDENWIASTYAIHWLRSIRYSHRVRSVLRTATNIQGTGFLFAHELVKNGWNYTSLTEDRAFTADAVAQGYPISYCDAAIFYDEQPTNLKVALRQRLRWSKGHLMAFTETGPQLFKNFIMGPRYKKASKPEKKNVQYHCKPRPETWHKRLIEQIRFRWASYDTFVQLFPTGVINFFAWLIVFTFIFGCSKYATGVTNEYILNEITLFGVTLQTPFSGISINISRGFDAMFAAIFISVIQRAVSKLVSYIQAFVTPLYLFFTERKRIVPIPWYKKLLYTITWPIFDIIGRWTSYVAVFKKVEWKPIPHTSTVTIEQIENATEEKKNENKKREISTNSDNNK